MYMKVGSSPASSAPAFTTNVFQVQKKKTDLCYASNVPQTTSSTILTG